MITNLTRRVTAAITGAAATAGILTGIALAAPVQATAAPTAATNCTTAPRPSRTGLSSPNPLTRAGQVATIGNASTGPVAAVSCLGH